MTRKVRTAFFAYPSNPVDLRHTIERAARDINTSDLRISLRTWPELPVFGAVITDNIRSSIEEVDALICDVTIQNNNVYYEIGYAIGVGKTVAPVVNSSFASAISNIQHDGIFDNVGYNQYENSEQLKSHVEGLPIHSLVDLYSKPLNQKQPIFIFDTQKKTDFRNSIVSAVKSSRMFYRSFDPVETPRFSSVNMISEISSSSGVIIPLLADHIDDANRHNLRAAFLAGLSHGLKRPTLLIRLLVDSKPDPLDYRNEVTNVRSDLDVTKVVSEFASSAHIALQYVETSRPKALARSGLQQLSFGASSAENEFRNLEDYFVETAEYLRTLRGDIKVVAGRKGSGKTAIFFQVRDALRQEKNCFVTDLKPESHQLSLFRAELLKVVGIGVFDHTLAAFWYLVVSSELLLTLRRHFESRSRYDASALNSLREIDDFLVNSVVEQSGDFTSRINKLGSRILQDIEATSSKNESLTPEKITSIVFRAGISPIKNLLYKYLDKKSLIVLLFDNIDKGWPSNGVDTFDVRLVRLLIESLDKIRNDFAASDFEFRSVVFLRNDIFELLLSETPDRGKAGQIRIDWTDKAKIKQVIHRRLQNSAKNKRAEFDYLWNQYFDAEVEGQDSFEYLINHCLMRPRFLIILLEYAVANAVNRGLAKVDAISMRDAVRQHSLYLIDDFGYEIRDVSGVTADILYYLVGLPAMITTDELFHALSKVGEKRSDNFDNNKIEYIIYLLLWYGVLGIFDKNNEKKYIYDYEYNMKRLEAEIKYLGTDVFYLINPALHVGLSS